MIIYVTPDGAQSEPVDNPVDCGDNIFRCMAEVSRKNNTRLKLRCIAQTINEINHAYIYRSASSMDRAYARILIADLTKIRRMGINNAVQPEPLPIRKLDQHDAYAIYKKARR